MSITKFDIIKANKIDVKAIKIGTDKDVYFTPSENLYIETKNTSITGGAVNITADKNKDINFTTSGTGKLFYNGSEIGQGGVSGIPNEGNTVDVDFELTRNSIAFNASTVQCNGEDVVIMSDLEEYVKTEELADYATKSDIADFITADDLTDYATKEDIADFITEEALTDYATKEELEEKVDSATVVELQNTIVELQNTIATLERRLNLLKDDVQAFREDMDDVVDLDPGKPGVQDYEGETTFYVNTVEDVATAFENLSDGDEIRIKSDISTDEIGNALVFDGQDNTLSIGNNNTFTSGSSTTNNIKVSNGTLTVTGNGTIETTDAYDNTHSTVLLAAESGGTLVLDGVKVNAVIGDTPEQAVDKGQFGVGVYGDGNVVVEDADMTTGWYCISGNGTTTSADATVTINGGNLTSTVDFAIYHPYPGTLIINDGNIIGGAGAISMNNGNAIINGGNLSSRGDGDTGSWSDGTSGQADAIINLNAKYGAVNCEINGGTFTAIGDAEIIVSENPKFPVTVSIKGGRFNKQLTNPDWIAEGYVMSDVPDSEGYYTVTKA